MKVYLDIDEAYPVVKVISNDNADPDYDLLYDMPEDLIDEFQEAESAYWTLHSKVLKLKEEQDNDT